MMSKDRRRRGVRGIRLTILSRSKLPEMNVLDRVINPRVLQPNVIKSKKVVEQKIRRIYYKKCLRGMVHFSINKIFHDGSGAR